MITVQGDIKLADGTPHVGDIVFYPLSTPLAVVTDVIFTAPIIITTDATGSFSSTFAGGEYNLNPVISATRGNPVKMIRIRVPNSVDGEYDATVQLYQLLPSGINRPEYFGGLPGGSGVTVTINDTSGVAYRGVASLRARTAHLDTQMAFISYANTEAGGGAGFFEFVSASAVADDGIDCICPDDITHPAPGRWLRRS